MKRLQTIRTLLMRALAGAALVVASWGVLSCQDKVDQSDMYTFTGQQVIDYLNSTQETSYFAYLATKVKLSRKSQSTVAELLSSRGNYTCFVPSNEAVQSYLDSVYNITGYDYMLTPDSTAEAIVNNSIIDNDTKEPYLSTGFVDNQTMEDSNFADRYLTVRFDTLPGGKLAVMINTFSRIIVPDIELTNGVIHIVDRVITPSNSTVPTLISEMPDLKIFSRLLVETGWADQMTDFRDEDYEENHPLEGKGCPTERQIVPCPEHRDQGYTAFVEPDSIFVQKWGVPEPVLAENGTIENWDDILAVIRTKAAETYTDATSSDLTSEDNAVNQFVSYHLLDVGLTYDHIVIHYNEQGYSYSQKTLGIDAWAYHTTMGKHRRILKVMEGSQTGGKRINRYVSERNLTNYREVTVPRPGIKINEARRGSEFAALNGYYYTIDDMLVYDAEIPYTVLNERMRFDISACLPEMSSNNWRRSYSYNDQIHVPHGYFKNMTFTEETNVVYLSGYECGWSNYEGDEYNIQGCYDVVVKLPPVPIRGTYQLRYGTSNVADRRSMCQFYIGTNPNHLSACGLPMDMRIDGTIDYIGWQPDTRDPDVNEMQDRAIYLKSYMKAPIYFGRGASKAGVSNNCRGQSNVFRRIVWTGVMDPAQDYYLRMKSVLDNTNLQLFIDYFEFVPKTVYENPLAAEDKW